MVKISQAECLGCSDKRKYWSPFALLLFIHGRFSTGILLKSQPRKMSKAVVYLYEPQIGQDYECRTTKVLSIKKWMFVSISNCIIKAFIQAGMSRATLKFSDRVSHWITVCNYRWVGIANLYRLGWSQTLKKWKVIFS